MGVRYSKDKVTWLGRPFEYQTFWTMNRLYFSLVFKPPFVYRTIWQPDTNLPFENQTSPVFRWLLYPLFYLETSLNVSSLFQTCKGCPDIQCQFTKYEKSTLTFGLQWFNLFALYWSINFVTSLGELVLAGVFATWYWTWDKVLFKINWIEK